jgi:hypothetical protein
MATRHPHRQFRLRRYLQQRYGCSGRRDCTRYPTERQDRSLRLEHNIRYRYGRRDATLLTELASGATGSTFRHKRIGERGILEIMHEEFDGTVAEHATQILVTIACFFSTK